MNRENSTEGVPEQEKTEEEMGDSNNMNLRNMSRTLESISTMPRNMTFKIKDTKIMIQTDSGRGTESFHTAVGKILAMAQCFGIMPVRGVLARTPDELQFKYRSMRMAYSSLFLIYLLIIVILAFLHIGKEVTFHGTKFLKDIRGIIWGGVFYGNAFTATLLFLRLAPRWKSLMDIWRGVEHNLRFLPFPPLSRRFNIIAAAIMVPALCEHVLSIPMSIPECFYEHQDYPCLKDLDNTTFGISLNASIIFELYSKRSHNYIFEVVSYNSCLAAFLFLGYRLAAFIWNFTDLFLILIGIGLSERFTQFNARLKEANRTIIKPKDWQDLRYHYNLLSTLVKLIDSEVSAIVLLSFANNLCCIGLQLVKTMSDDTCAYDRTYYFLSFVFLMGRTVMVTLSTARINEESKAALQEINRCRPESECVEMERLQTQIRTDEIALTGLGIFPVTRSFLLVVAGCVFTYVVVLLQFFVAINTAVPPLSAAPAMGQQMTTLPVTTLPVITLPAASLPVTNVPVTAFPFTTTVSVNTASAVRTTSNVRMTQESTRYPVTIPYRPIPHPRNFTHILRQRITNSSDFRGNT